MIFRLTGACRGYPGAEIWLKMLQISLFSFQYVNELSGGNQGGQAHENQSELLKRKNSARTADNAASGTKVL